MVPFLDQFLPLKVFQGHSLLKRGNCSFSKVKTLILRKSANFGQNSKSKTILESGKNSASGGQNIFFKKFDQIFFFQKIDFSRLVLWSKSPPQKVFFFVHGMMGHTQTNILRVFLKKNEIIKFFRKWKKRKSDLYFNSWPPGQKNPTLRGSKYFRAPKYFRGTPFWDFWPLKVPKKWHFSSKTKIGPQFQFTGSWPKKSNFEGVKIFLGPKICLMYSILVFLTLESTKKWFVFIKNIKKFACWNIANFVMFLMKTNGTFKGQKS